MIVVSNKPSQPFEPERDLGVASESGSAASDPPTYSMENLFADPEVCRRVGAIISKAAERRPQRRPAPRRRSS
jgi:hypothetical protein